MGGAHPFERSAFESADHDFCLFHWPSENVGVPSDKTDPDGSRKEPTRMGWMRNPLRSEGVAPSGSTGGAMLAVGDRMACSGSSPPTPCTPCSSARRAECVTSPETGLWNRKLEPLASAFECGRWARYSRYPPKSKSKSQGNEMLYRASTVEQRVPSQSIDVS